MNANELADAMEIRASIRRKATSRKSVTEGANDRLADQLEQAATMLRQQQAEIETLKFGKEAAKAWSEISFKKELTDEEIKSEAKYLCHGWHSENPERLVLFARAILRKAQEK